MGGKPGFDALKPPRVKAGRVTDRDRHRATQWTLRVAQRDGWSRAEIQEVLEALGLVERSALGPSPSGGAKNAPTAASGASTGRQREWCGRGLHRMVGETVYTSPEGDRRCRKCHQALRSGCDAAEMHPAEPGSPKYNPDVWCGRGLHEMVGDNLISKTDGSRECRACRLWRKRRQRARDRGLPFDEDPE